MSVNNGRSNFGMAPEAMVAVTVVDEIVEAGVGTKVTVLQVAGADPKVTLKISAKM